MEYRVEQYQDSFSLTVEYPNFYCEIFVSTEDIELNRIKFIDDKEGNTKVVISVDNICTTISHCLFEYNGYNFRYNNATVNKEIIKDLKSIVMSYGVHKSHKKKQLSIVYV